MLAWPLGETALPGAKNADARCLFAALSDAGRMRLMKGKQASFQGCRGKGIFSHPSPVLFHTKTLLVITTGNL